MGSVPEGAACRGELCKFDRICTGHDGTVVRNHNRTHELTDAKLIRGSSSASSKLRPWASIDVVFQLDAGKDFQ